MPTYDYECQSCGHRFEHFGRLHETGLRPCPRCHKKKAKRLIGAGAGFIFKGSGFYVTDSRKSHSGNGSSSPAKPEAKSDAKPSSESKPKKKSD